MMASRKGVEPLTPGLGNLCSIQLSYRDNLPRVQCLSVLGRAGRRFKLMIRIAFPFQERLIKNRCFIRLSDGTAEEPDA